jgi:hypothetical protein
MNKWIEVFRRRRWIKILTFAFLGGAGGFAYYYFIGCQSGSCPISSNPYISTSYGMLIGFLFSLDKKKGKE